jgi:hypothetical protein
MTATSSSRPSITTAPGALKNALDYGGKSWRNKPVAFVGYTAGDTGAARAVEPRRTISPSRAASRPAASRARFSQRSGNDLKTPPLRDTSRAWPIPRARSPETVDGRSVCDAHDMLLIRDDRAVVLAALRISTAGTACGVQVY